MLPLSIQLLVGAVVLAGVWKLWSQPKARRSHPLPPGPPGDPILGHVRIIPASRPELAYQKWGKEYKSDVLYFELGGQPLVVLNSVQASMDILDKRGGNNSDRPPFPMFEEQGWGDSLTFTSSGPKYRRHRKMFQNALSVANVVPYKKVQTKEARTTALSILEEPEEWRSSLIHFATSLIMGLTYGIPIARDNDPYLDLAHHGSIAISNGGPPGGTATDIFPIVRYLPYWLSILPSLKFARKYAPLVLRLHEVPFARVQTEMEHGIAPESFTKSMLEQKMRDNSAKAEDSITDADIKGAGGTSFVAGQDTTWTTITIFVLNAVLNPEVQVKAWAEIDAVIGRDRLPTFDDRSKLPYLEHIVQETFRWHPVVATGIPHKSIEDDVYNGMFIPAGSIIFPNAFAMTHDESVYKDPEVFNPDRYSVTADTEAEPFPVGHFGFGRRICPGQHLGIASVWMVIATLLATSEFTKALDENGEEITPAPKMTTGLTSHPEPFKCHVKERYSGAKELLARG